MVWCPEWLQAAVTVCQTEKERKRKNRIIRPSQQVPTHSEELLDDTVQAEEPLSLAGTFEATHVPFPLSRSLMRALHTIVGVSFRVVGYSIQDRSHCS